MIAALLALLRGDTPPRPLCLDGACDGYAGWWQALPGVGDDGTRYLTPGTLPDFSWLRERAS